MRSSLIKPLFLPCIALVLGMCAPAASASTLPQGVSSVWRLRFAEKPDALGPRIQVTGIVEKQHFSPSSIMAASTDKDVPLAMPMGSPLLGDLAYRTFGLEERVELTPSPDQTLAVSCRAGKSVAGVVFHSNTERLPTGARGELNIQAYGDAGFQWGIARPGQDAALLQPVSALDGKQLKASIPLEQIAALGDGPASFVLMCPLHEAQLMIQSIALAPVPVVGSGLRAAWNWNAERWHNDSKTLIKQALELDLQRLYIAVDMDAIGKQVKDAALLADFITHASSAGIDVWAVEGDPAMATPQGREHALQRLKAIQAYQASAPQVARLGGVQYDIEPYLLPAYQKSPQKVAQQWSQTIVALSQQSQLKLDMVLPFWLPLSPFKDSVMAALQDSDSSITIMAYRVEPQAIQRVAEPLLSWGVKHAKSVHVGLEAGPLKDELTQFYVEAPRADPALLWLMPAQEGGEAILLSEPAHLSQGKGYNPSGQQLSSASVVSFNGDYQSMLGTAGRLQPVFAAWSSYAGMVFHGLLK